MTGDGGITVAHEEYVADPDHLIKSLQAEEEKKWAEIERKHNEQNRQ